MLKFSGLSDIGLLREENQDAFGHATNLNDDFMAIVCDGVAGNYGGGLASQIVVDVLMQEFKKVINFKTAYEVKKWIIANCQKANDELIKYGKKDIRYIGMATTLVGLIVSTKGSFIFNIGDSRAYGLYDKFLCLTKDHNVERYIKEKGNTIKLDVTTRKDALSNALGIYNVVDVDVLKIKDHYQKIVLCTDGLYKHLNIHEILNILSEKINVEILTQRFVDESLKRGGSDNVTVFVIERSENNDNY